MSVATYWSTLIKFLIKNYRLMTTLLNLVLLRCSTKHQRKYYELTAEQYFHLLSQVSNTRGRICKHQFSDFIDISNLS